MRAKEVATLRGARVEESRFLSRFQTVPKNNSQGLSRHGSDIVNSNAMKDVASGTIRVAGESNGGDEKAA
ncbi:MAG: hypothetical protein MN733_35530 [Nitrososphaera sp.]|nr:hypothetical protein [Nitrososphaera sp.]